MYSLSARFNSLTSAFMTALAITAVVISYLSYSSMLSIPADFFDESVNFKITDYKISTKKLRSYGGSSSMPKENVKFKFDLVSDLTPLIDFNTKQIFVYIYLDLDEPSDKSTQELFDMDAKNVKGKDHPHHQDSLYEDHEVHTPGTRTLGGAVNGIEKDNKLVFWDKIITGNSGYLNFKNLKSKYSVWDHYPELKGRSGTFKLAYNLQPWVGPLLYGEIDLKESIIL